MIKRQAFALDQLRQGRDLAEALRAAQLDLARNIAGGSHPALWGAFALVGPGSPEARPVTAASGNPPHGAGQAGTASASAAGG